MKYMFDTELAKTYGVDGAIMLENICFWIQKNKANEKHFYDGRYWTYNSMKAFESVFPFWSNSQIRRILEKLENEGAIVTGNYNNIAYDRTKWYAVVDSVYSIWENQQNHLSKSANGTDENNKPIPYINTDNKNTDNKPDIYSDFEKIIKQKYLGKKTKATRNKVVPKLLKKYSVEELTRVLDRYASECKGKEKRYILNESTFWNGRYMDYLDENYEDNVNSKKVTPIDNGWLEDF